MDPLAQHADTNYCSAVLFSERDNSQISVAKASKISSQMAQYS
jgi:hypothetical protein